MVEICVVPGSLVDQDVDYIVNAANTMMRGGGGIDGVIHRLAGPKLLLELYRVAPKGCKTGDVVVTGAHDLKHKGIIHTPGPRGKGGNDGEAELLAASYRNSLAAVDALGGESIGFCSISTGSYRFPLELAAPIAVSAVRAWVVSEPDTTIERVVFAMFSESEYRAYLDAVAAQ
jgi:O-acetyl-ADP-ribose deacetylase (regulator of RNase III)